MPMQRPAYDPEKEIPKPMAPPEPDNPMPDLPPNHPKEVRVEWGGVQ